MFPITITLHNIAQLTAVMAAINTAPTGATAVDGSTGHTSATEQAPGKPSGAETAPSQRTAAAAPSPSADPKAQDAAREPKVTEATSPDADATSAGQPVTYADLQKAVITLHKMDPTAAVPIAKGLGADTFKLLPEAKWAEALRLVNEAIETRKVA